MHCAPHLQRNCTHVIRAVANGVIAATSITALMVFRGTYAEMARDHGAGVETGTTALAIALGLTLCIFLGFLIAEKLTPRPLRKDWVV